MTLYSDQPFEPNVPVQQKQKEPDFIFYFIILYKYPLQPAACMENGLKGLKGWCHWELKCRILLCVINTRGYFSPGPGSGRSDGESPALRVASDGERKRYPLSHEILSNNGTLIMLTKYKNTGRVAG